MGRLLEICAPHIAGMTEALLEAVEQHLDARGLGVRSCSPLRPGEMASAPSSINTANAAQNRRAKSPRDSMEDESGEAFSCLMADESVPAQSTPFQNPLRGRKRPSKKGTVESISEHPTKEVEAELSGDSGSDSGFRSMLAPPAVGNRDPSKGTPGISNRGPSTAEAARATALAATTPQYLVRSPGEPHRSPAISPLMVTTTPQPQQSSPTTEPWVVSVAAAAEARGTSEASAAPSGEAQAAAKVSSPPEGGKHIMVCRHWKSKGFCKLEASCKFQHPEHKRGGAARDIRSQSPARNATGAAAAASASGNAPSVSSGGKRSGSSRRRAKQKREEEEAASKVEHPAGVIPGLVTAKPSS